MSKSKIFLILSLSFIGGIFFASFYYPRIINNFLIFFFIIAALIIIFSFWKNKWTLILGAAIMFFSLGLWLAANRLEKIVFLNQDAVIFSGEVEVLKEPETKGRFQKIIARSSGLEGKILINSYIYPEYKYGDRLKLNCVLEIPKSFDSDKDRGNNFDYQLYLAKDRIYYVCQKPKIELVSSGGKKFYKTVLAVKNKFEESIEKFMPAPESGLLIGLLLGGDDKLSKEMQNNFSRTGMTHIVAVSGYNVTIIAEYLIMLGIFFGLWRRQAFWFAALGIFLFIFMIGFPSSAVRAGIMGALLLWAMKNGRLANSQNAIIFSAGVMLFINPLLLRWDIGFQLSFLATMGIVFLYPLLEKNLVLKNKTFGIWEIFLLSISAQIFVLPIIIYNFGQLSVISPLANILVLPIVPFTMLLGFVSSFLGVFSAILGTIFAWLAFLPLKYEVWIINFLAKSPFSSVEIKNFSWLAVLFWYAILGSILIFLKRKTKQ